MARQGFKVAAIIFIFLFGFLIYSNALFNDFVWDDIYQIVKAPYIHSPVFIPLYFVSSVQDASGNSSVFSYYYKPLLYSVYSILYFFGEGKQFIFHFFQIGLHSFNAILLFYLLKLHIKPVLAFFLTLIFLTSSVNEETVAYIANLQDILFFFFGMIALLLIAYQHFTQINRLRFVSLFLFLSLLSKETGILFTGISFIYIVFFEKKLLVKTAIFFIFLLSLYSVLRIISSDLQLLPLVRSEVMDMDFLERIRYIPKILFYYLKEIFIPSETFSVDVKIPTNIHYIYELVFLTGTLALHFLFFTIILYFWRSKYFYPALFFLIWFVIGIGMHLQIIPLDATVAKRWLYFPLAGLLGLIGVFITRLNLSRNYLVYIILMFLIGFYCQQTYRMNTYWQDIEKINQTNNLP